MEGPSFLRRHPWVRWLAPAAVVGLAALLTTGVFSGGGAPTSQRLPVTTPTALIHSVQTAAVSGYSGTVVSRVSLGLPELPGIGGGGGDSASFASLLDGSHTLQVWYGGAEEQRIAVLGATDETDVFRSGRDVWQWDSSKHVATHIVLPARGRHGSDRVARVVGPHSNPTGVVTPGSLAGQALRAIEPSTHVQVRRGAPVADRSTYELVLTPKDATTLVGSVHIAIDGATKVPLGVQVYPRGSTSPAINISYTSINFGRPSRTNFSFSPPEGASVRQLHLGALMAAAGGSRGQGHHSAPAQVAGRRVKTFGADWSTVLGYRVGSDVAAEVSRYGGLVAHAFVPVSGSWGRGRVLETKLVSVLLTDNGWVYVGAVSPVTLSAAAASR